MNNLKLNKKVLKYQLFSILRTFLSLRNLHWPNVEHVELVNNGITKMVIDVTKFIGNEEPACQKTRQTLLESIIPKDVMMSFLSLLTSNCRKISVQFSTGFWQKKTLCI
jgi:hypothetical protein